MGGTVSAAEKNGEDYIRKRLRRAPRGLTHWRAPGNGGGPVLLLRLWWPVVATPSPSFLRDDQFAISREHGGREV